MQERILTSELMTFEEFFEFVQTRPDEERWELFDGVKVMQASANNRHQTIVGNVNTLLTVHSWNMNAPWSVLPGLGVHDEGDPRSAPLPDVIVRPRSLGTEYYCNDAITTFEVLSPKTKSRDLTWKLKHYSNLATMQHYLIVEQDEVLVRHYARDNGWKERKFRKPVDVLRLTALGVDLTLADIYRNTGHIP